MNREQELFDAAVDLPPAERQAFLDRECAGDRALRTRLEALLAGNDRADAFFATAGIERPPLPPEEKPGDRIGRYKLLQKIGEGGCGTVYMAEQQEPVRRRVALKVIKLGMDTKAVIARFEAERQALALMEHPNIARVLDAGATDTGRPYFVMELVCGVPITRHCDQENLSAKERLELFIDVCSAIQHAHAKGIVHRDIKPSNILVTMQDDTPTPKVIDFGIAKATQGRLTDHTLFTAFEQFIGTPAYMSPEQAQLNDAVDTRSDIYSLGVLLYELLTGQPPFDPKTLQQQGIDEMRRIIREVEPPRPSTRLDTLGEADRAAIAKARRLAPAQLSTLVRGDLDWIAMKAIDKKRARRYETAGALAADVKRHLSHEPVLARPPSVAYRMQKFGVRHRFALVASGAVVAALAIGLTLSRVLPGGTEHHGASALTSTGSANVRTLYSGTGDEAGGALSPDESAIAFVKWIDGGGALVVKDLRTGAQRTVVPVPDGKEKPFVDDFLWAPDSQSLAYTWFEGKQRTSLRIISRHGGEPRIIKPATDGYPLPFDWSRDGKLLLVPLPGEKNRGLATLTLATGEYATVGGTPHSGRHPRFSPDAKYVVYESRNAQKQTGITIVSVDHEETVAVTESPEDRKPVFSLDGRYVLFSSNRTGAWALWAVPVQNGRPIGDPFTVKHDFGNHDKAITAFGNLAFATTGNETGLVIADDVFVLPASDRTAVVTGRPSLQSKPSSGRSFTPAWSPDGTKLAYITLQGTGETPRAQRLAVQSIPGGAVEFTNVRMLNWDRLFWSPDGKSILLHGAGPGGEVDRGLYRFAVEERRFSARPVATGWPLGFLATGEFMLWRDGTGQVALNLTSGEERIVSSASEAAELGAVLATKPHHFDFTPDQSLVAWVDHREGEEDLVVADLSLRNRRILAHVAAPGQIRHPRWSPDRTKVAYHTTKDASLGPAQLHVAAADGSWTATAGSGERYADAFTGAVAWSADSTQLAVTLRKNLVTQIGLLTDFLPAEKTP